MDEGEIKTCENCKREIPAVNFTIHAVHCARNIRMCPVCKEPVPHADLHDHHEKMHKLSPCKQCGESVCGTDMQDHIRDSCAHTMQACRFCALELRRGALPAHERYCGARTERCECGERVMHKYRALHKASNHGFVRLDDDPVPIEDIKATNVPKHVNSPKPSSSKPDVCNVPKATNIDNRPLSEIRYFPQTDTSNSIPSTSQSHNTTQTHTNALSTSRSEPVALSAALRESNAVDAGSTALANGLGSSAHNGAVPRAKRSNDQPQVNTAAAAPDKVHKKLWASRGAVKKRPAPKPPAAPAPDPQREQSLQSALQRRQREDERRQEQTADNLARGLPPVLSAAEKLDRLRKMDALQNPTTDDQDYKNCLQGRVWRAAEVSPRGHALGADAAVPQHLETERRKNELKNLKPMSPAEFMDRFNELQLMKEPPEQRAAIDDRFSQIKSSLRELRRGLNEVTAPYSSSSNNDSPVHGAVWLPCEFCGAPVPDDRLVQHQTGCRPDLAQYRPAAGSRSPSRPASRAASPSPRASRSASPAPVIPCEFCTAPMPVYLISEHQERCGREANLLFPD